MQKTQMELYAPRPLAAPLQRWATLGPVLRRGAALAVGFAGGWAEMYGALTPFGLGLTLGAGEDCFAACAVGAVLAVLARGQGVRYCGGGLPLPGGQAALPCGLRRGLPDRRPLRPPTRTVLWILRGGGSCRGGLWAAAPAVAALG